MSFPFVPAEVAFITWAGSRLFELWEKEPLRAAECRLRVAEYFDELAESLSAISTSLRANQIPRIEGHRLAALIQCFELTMASNFYGKHHLKGEEGERLLIDLRDSARAAQDADYFVRESGIVEVAPGSVEVLIERVERASGRFRGLAGMMRAVGPFKSKSATSRA